MTTLILLSLLNIQQVGEWYDKATRATISANQQMNDAGRKAQADWKRLESRKGKIRTRQDLLGLIRDAKTIVRTLESRHNRARSTHEKSRRFRNALPEPLFK